MNFNTTAEARKALKDQLGEALLPNMKVGVRGMRIMGDYRYFVSFTIEDPAFFTKPVDVCAVTHMAAGAMEKYGHAIRLVEAWRKVRPCHTIGNVNIL